jgi:hypothetical protein
VVEKMDYKEIFEKEFERIINQKIDEVMENYEKTLYEELSTLALNINSIRAIAILTHIIDINYKPTNWVYAIYRKLCDAMKEPGMSNIEFSRFMVKWFNCIVIDKKINGKKHRVFVKIPDDNEDAVQDVAKVQDESKM